MHTRDCTSDAVVETVSTIESLGAAQYQQYVTDVITNRTVQIQQPIKKNSLPLFKRPLPKKSKKVTQDLANLKSDCNLFSHLYIASKFRDGNLEDFFKHENHPWPPSLSEQGQLRLPTKKSDLLTFLASVADLQPPSYYDAKVLDDPAIIHSLPVKEARTFDGYSDNIIIPWTKQMLQNSNRIDVIWDVYKADSLKEFTRAKRGKGVRRKVSGQTKLPPNFKDFLRD